MGKVVQFEADFEKIDLAKKNTIKLVLPENTKFEQIVEIARMKGTRIIVQFGDPQMSISFDVEEELQSIQYSVALDVTVNVRKTEELEGQQGYLFDEDDHEFDDEEDDDVGVGMNFAPDKTPPYAA